MKLSKELKDKIDQYFEHISAEELFDISIGKYGFQEDTSLSIVNQPFALGELDIYSAHTNEGCFTTLEPNSLSFAA